MIATVYTAAERAAALVDQLLELMRSRAGVLQPEEVRLDEIFIRSAGELEGTASSRGIRIETDTVEATVLGDPVLMNSMATNLIENAIRHNVDDGHVAIRVVPDQGNAVVHVDNTGAPVNDTTLDRITQPFHRGAANPDSIGHGLGTTIIRTVTEAHDGTVAYQARTDGGIEVRINLPLVAPTVMADDLDCDLA